VSVKTLHTLLRLNQQCSIDKNSLEIVFAQDDHSKKNEVFLKKLKMADRIIWIDYSVHIDEASLKLASSPLLPSYHCLVFPSVKEGIDWSMFKSKVSSGSDEPLNQMGLSFDTDVGKSIGENFHIVIDANPKCWAIDCKHILKALKDKKGEGVKLGASIFGTFKDRDVKMYAFTDAKITVTYPHECLGNILACANVKMT